MLINVEISIALEVQVESPVPCKYSQHVVEEPDARPDLVLAASFDGEMDGDTSFRSDRVQRWKFAQSCLACGRCFLSGSSLHFLSEIQGPQCFIECGYCT